MAEESEQYQPKDTLKETFDATVLGTAVGFGASAVQNVLTKRNVGAMGVFSRTGGTIATFASMLGVYQFVRYASANLRERDDSLNPTIGGFFSGSILGLRIRSTPAMLGYGALAAVTMGVFDFGGGALGGPGKDPAVDEFERKEQLRRNRRGPIEEAIKIHGEGRGIYGPGYRERRAERLKEKYGIEVPT